MLDLKHLDSNAQIMPLQKENVSDYKTNIWRKKSSSTTSSEQTKRHNLKQFEGSEDYDYVVDWRTGW